MTKNRSGRPSANSVDIHVGSRLREQRKLRNMSQSVLGEKLGLTFQQVQKYEKGANRISAGKLWQIGQILGVPVESFYAKMPSGISAKYANDDLLPPVEDVVLDGDMIKLITSYRRIESNQIRQRILALTRSVSESLNDAVEK